jgi:uncharacterized phiE125 gp8 family phage protein
MTVTAGRFRLITDAAAEPLTLADAKAYAQVDGTTDDAMITSLIVAARRFAEKKSGLAVLDQTWLAVLDRWPVQSGFSAPWWDGVREGPASMLSAAIEPIEIVKRPFQAVTQIQLRDQDGGLTTVDSSLYFVEASGYTGRVVRKAGSTWPSVTLSPVGGVEIRFTAGFGAAADDVPEDITTGLKMLVKHWYDNRNVSCDGGGGPVPAHMSAIFCAWAAKRLR